MHSANNDLWQDIENKLSFNKPALQKLPHHKASSALWNVIDTKIQHHYKQKRRRIITLTSSISGIAASILLVLYIQTNVSTNIPNNSVVLHTEEIATPNNTYIQSASTVSSNDNIVGYCTNYPDICSSPEFVQLKAKWQNLKSELQKLRAMSLYQSDDQVLVYITRIEQDIHQLENRMMLMFM